MTNRQFCHINMCHCFCNVTSGYFKARLDWHIDQPLVYNVATSSWRTTQSFALLYYDRIHDVFFWGCSCWRAESMSAEVWHDVRRHGPENKVTTSFPDINGNLHSFLSLPHCCQHRLRTSQHSTGSRSEFQWWATEDSNQSQEWRHICISAVKLALLSISGSLSQGRISTSKAKHNSVDNKQLCEVYWI